MLGFWISLGLAVAKLFGLAISWWWVAAPLLIGTGIVFGIWIIAIVIAAIAAIVVAIFNK
jgi:hypothetical protein